MARKLWFGESYDRSLEDDNKRRMALGINEQDEAAWRQSELAKIDF